MYQRALIAALLLMLTSSFPGCQDDLESRLAEIRALQSAGQFESSIQPARALLSTHTDNAEANYRLGVALVQTGRRSLAVWPLQKASQSQEWGVQAGLVLATTLISLEAYEEAIKATDRVLELDPERIAALYSRANANIGAGRPEEALADADRVLALRPDDTQAYTIRSGALIDLQRYDEAEQNHTHLKALTEAGGDPERAARACGLLGVFHSKQEQLEKADADFQDCLEKYPGHGLVQQWASDFYISTDRPEQAIAIFEAAIERAPEDLALRSKLADLRMDNDQNEAAEAGLKEAVELFDTPTAWQMLSSFYRKTGETTKAREALETALERANTSPEPVLFGLGDLLVEEGELERARELAQGLKEPSYKNLLLGAIALKSGDPKQALELLNAGIRLWPNNAGARYMAGRAALEIGDTDRAIAEFRESVRVDDRLTDAALELARLHFSIGEYDAARQFAERQIRRRPYTDPSPYVISARSAARAGRLQEAQATLERLKEKAPEDPSYAVEYAGIIRQAQGPDAAEKAVRRSGFDLTDPKNEPALRALTDDLVAQEKNDEALALVDAALADHPDVPELLDLKARVLLRAGRVEDARKVAERALEVDSEFAATLEILATLAAQAGDLELALSTMDRAAAADPSDPDYAYSAAQLCSLLGRTEDAEERLREALVRSPGHVGAANDLAWALAESDRDLDLALKLAQRAVRVGPSPDTLDTLGWVQYKRGDSRAAVATLKRALAERTESASIRYRLGLALAAGGDSNAAMAMLREAVDGGKFPEAEAARQELARLEGS